MAKVFFQKFENIKTFERFLTTTPKAPSYKFATASTNDDKSTKKFTKTENYEAANNLLLYGDKKTAKSIGEAGFDEAVKATKYESRRVYSSNVVGCAVNVPNYLAGVPCNMIRCTMQRQPKNVLTIGYNMSVGSATTASAIQTAAAKLLAAIVTLEAKGVRCNLYALNHSKSFSNNDEALLAIKIKNASQPLDLLKCAYPMAHPSMNRRHKFRWLEVSEAFEYDGYYGQCVSDTQKSISKFAEYGLHFDNIFTHYDLYHLTAEQIIGKLLKGQN